MIAAPFMESRNGQAWVNGAGNRIAVKALLSSWALQGQRSLRIQSERPDLVNRGAKTLPSLSSIEDLTHQSGRSADILSQKEVHQHRFRGPRIKLCKNILRLAVANLYITTTSALLRSEIYRFIGSGLGNLDPVLYQTFTARSLAPFQNSRIFEYIHSLPKVAGWLSNGARFSPHPAACTTLPSPREEMDHIVTLLARQSDAGTSPQCDAGNQYDGRLGLRIASIFVIWVGSMFGAVFPVFAKNHQSLGVPDWSFFVAKFFGSGVIIATAFIHLLSPAENALRNPCLTGPITEYDWVSGIVLMTIFALFFIELMVMRYSEIAPPEHSGVVVDASTDVDMEASKDNRGPSTHQPGHDHLGHAQRHNSIEDANNPFSFEDYKAQLTSIFILEFGIIFHSVFIGLTLAVSGEEFITLFIVLVFHQTFEGLGLGSRLAVTPWPKSRKWTPYVLAAAYGFTTPIAIAIGLGVRNSYPPASAMTLVINGVFDSISAGILIYTGLVELMAHEFIFSRTMRNAPMKTVLSAIFLMCLGAALMALLGKWA